MVRRQHGVVTRRDLVALGFSRGGIEHRLACGRLHLVSPGVGTPHRCFDRRRSRLERPGIKVGSRASLPSRSLTTRHGISVTVPVQTLIDRHTFRLSDSDLEVLFRPLARAAAFPPPMTKQVAMGYEVDFWFPAQGLVVETDGLRYHRTPAQQARAVNTAAAT